MIILSKYFLNSFLKHVRNVSVNEMLFSIGQIIQHLATFLYTMNMGCSSIYLSLSSGLRIISVFF